MSQNNKKDQFSILTPEQKRRSRLLEIFRKLKELRQSNDPEDQEKVRKVEEILRGKSHK